jgi:hypothetical protein
LRSSFGLPFVFEGSNNFAWSNGEPPQQARRARVMIPPVKPGAKPVQVRILKAEPTS